MLEGAGVPVVMNRAGRAANAWPEPSLAEVPAPPGAWLAAELTSTHLCFMELHETPRVAVVTCLWPDHIELHGSLEAYAAAKRRLLEGQPRDGWAVLNADDAPGRLLLGEPRAANVAEFSVRGPVVCGTWVDGDRLWARWDGVTEDLGPLDPVAWAHPLAVAAAAAAALAAGVPARAIEPGPPGMAALPHRMHPVGTAGGARVIDDAMAATPSKARSALARFADGSVVLLAGGDDMLPGDRVHADPRERERLEEACGEAERAARLVVCFGPAAARLLPLLRRVPVRTAPDLPAAVEAARPHLGPGVTLLLSPMFPMAMADRERFAELVSRG
jgi:UDP-N-acetylmuramoylalanine--D-glutamate ligase